MARSILLVEDDADTRRGLALRLRSWGFDVVEAGDGHAAIAAAQRRRPDVVLLDLGLPAGDGFTVLERLRRLGDASDVPVVVLTARTGETDHRRARDLGALAVMVKPPDNEELRALLEAHAPPEAAAPAEGRVRPRLMLIEDDADTRHALRVRLQASGYDVVTAGDASTALTHVVRERPDVIVLDLGLPGGDGMLVLERLKRNPTTANVPVVVLSARDAATHEPRALAGGASAYLQKPPDPADLLGAIERALGL